MRACASNALIAKQVNRDYRCCLCAHVNAVAMHGILIIAPFSFARLDVRVVFFDSGFCVLCVKAQRDVLYCCVLFAAEGSTNCRLCEFCVDGMKGPGTVCGYTPCTCSYDDTLRIPASHLTLSELENQGLHTLLICNG